MGALGTGDVHLDKAVENLTLAQIQDAAGFIAGDVFPIIQVDMKSDKYYTYDPTPFARDDVRVRGPRDTVNRVGFATSNDSYFCVDKAIGTDIPDQVRKASDPAIAATLQQTASDLLSSQWRQHFDRTFATNYFTTGVYGASAVGGFGLGTEVTGVTTSPTAGQFRRWDDYTNSSPITDVRTAIRAFQKQSAGIKPNRLVLSTGVKDALIDHPDIVDRVKFTDNALADEQMFLTGMARLFQIEKIVVASAVKTTSAEGAATPTFDFIQGPHALLAFRPPSVPNLMVPMTGAIFMWNGVGGGGGLGSSMPVKAWRDESTACDVYEAEAAFDMKVCSKSLGYFFYNAIS